MPEDARGASSDDSSTDSLPNMGLNAPKINGDWRPIGDAARSVVAAVLEAMAERQREEIARRHEEDRADD